jgi:GxxExxY protein
MMTDLAALDALKRRVIGCAIEVHRHLGPGLLESVYRHCLLIELLLAGLRVEAEKFVTIDYKGHRIPKMLKIDLLVEGSLVVELKAVDKLHPVHIAQTLTYLKLTGYPAGLLFNFNVPSLRQGIRSVQHPTIYRATARSSQRLKTEEEEF